VEVRVLVFRRSVTVANNGQAVLALLAIVSTLEGSIDAGGETGIKAGLSTVSSPRPATTNLPFP
jgi:hypothetical protein